MAVDPFADITQMMRGFQISQMLYVAAELDLADQIGESSPPTVAELAATTGAKQDNLLRLIRSLAAFGVFSVDQVGRVSHTPKSRYLRKDATPTLHYAIRYWGLASTWASWGNLRHTIMTGEPAFEATFGMPNFDYLRVNPEQNAIFDAFMRHSPDDRHAAVAAAYDFSKVGTVIDVGGGNGGLLRAILDRHPNVRGVLADQAQVVADAGEVLGPQARRCKLVPTNFFERVPAGGDIYTMSQILHDWNDVTCLKILANCRAAMKQGSQLFVIERILDSAPDRVHPMNFLSDMHMMVLFPGAKERTPEEFGQLFRQSGFAEPEVVATRTVFSIVKTRPI